MNKISKKIVALATMAAFVLTLVPAAAFAANDVSSVDPETSSVQTVEKDVEVYTGDKVAFKTNLNVKEDSTVYFWVEDEGHNVVNSVSYYADNKPETPAATDNYVYFGSEKVFKTTMQNNEVVKALSINKTGEYTIKAGVIKDANATIDSVKKLAPLQPVDNYSTINVKAAETEVTGIAFEEPVKDDALTIAPNSFATTTVTAKVTGEYTDKTGTPSMNGKVVSIDNGNNANKGLYVFEQGTEKAIDEVTVEAGEIVFDVKAMNGAIPGVYTIELAVDGYTKDLKVTVNGNSKVTAIEVVDTDSEYVDKDAPNFKGVAEVIFKDADGNVATVGNDDYQLQFVSAPEGFDKTANNTKLFLVPVENTDKYALAYAGTNLKAGEYKVRLGIVGQTASSAVVELTFTAAKVGDAVDLVIDVDNDAETIVSGGTVTGTVYAIDANGIKTAATDAVMGFANSAAVDTTTTADNKVITNVDLKNNAGKFTVKAKADEKYYGSKITLIAFDEDAKVQADPVELTVVDGMSTNTLSFDEEAGNIAKNNTVKVSVVDENGKAVAVSGQAYAYVESTSNEDAKVDVSFANDGVVTNGKINMTVYSDKETTADIVVAVKDSNTNAIYANTLTYAFGEQDIPVGTTVVMTIGSTDFVVNNEVITKEDAAPYIANDRTYVPFRALGEALGAEVVWDNDARTVTYTLGNTEVVMTIDETTYTVNGEEKTMDVAPVVTGDRTYVPVRFVGDALGFKVVALSATDGTTSSVVFQK